MFPTLHAFFGVLLIGVFTVTCTSYTVMGTHEEDIRRGVRPGDEVRVITIDDRDLRFTVSALTSDALVGDDAQVSFDNIARLEKQEHDDETAGMIVVVVAWLALSVATIAASVLFLLGL